MAGEVLLEKYFLEAALREGGLCSTYLAKNTETGEKLVIKHLHLSEPSFHKKAVLLENEARILANFDYKYIPALLDYFSYEGGSGKDFYLLREFISGKNLKELIKEGKIFTENEVLELALKVTDTLIYLNSFSPPVYHLDIKPENIIYSENKQPYLIDFGAPESNFSVEMEKQTISSIIGTQGYIPIEQFEGRPNTASDIYSLGLTLLYLLSGREPLQTEKSGLKFDFGKYINVSPYFEAVLEKMTEPFWKDRYTLPSELKKDLEYALKNSGKKESIRYYQLIRKVTDNNERILWTGRPSPLLMAAGKTIGSKKPFIFSAVIFMFLAVTMTLLSLSQLLPFISIASFPLGLLVLLSVISGTAGYSASAFLKAGNTYYAITDKRIIVLRSKGKKAKVTFINKDKIKILKKKKKRNGKCDLIIITETNSQPVILYGITDTDRLEKIISEHGSYDSLQGLNNIKEIGSA